jgi:hypothetical protein
MRSVDPHIERVLDTDDPYVAKRPVTGRVVCVLDARSERRGMQLEAHRSRAVPAGQIHELALTDDSAAGPGVRVDRVAYVGFVELERGGVLLVGDWVTVGERELGQVVGFDETHFPNHLNILVGGAAWETGGSLGVRVEAPVVFARRSRPAAS